MFANISIGKTPSRSENLSFLIHRWHRFSQIFGTTENTETHGSALGTHKAFSDIDVMLNPYALWPLRNFFNARLNELPIPYKIDLVLENHIEAPELQAHIARVGQVFYERKDVP